MRVAVTHALDREALTSVLYPEFGEPADTMFPPSVPDAGTPIAVDFDPDASTASRPSSAAPAAGPDAARAALDDAGWVVSGDGRAKDGQPLELDMLVSPSPTHGPAGPQTAAEAIASELEQVGIRVTIKDVDSAAYYDEQQAGHWDLSFLETFGAPYDPAATATAFLTTGAGGVPLWVSPELDGLVEAAVFATDEGERAADYQKVFDYLGAQAAFVPIAHPPRFWAVGPAVSGFEVPVTEYDMDLTAVTITR